MFSYIYRRDVCIGSFINTILRLFIVLGSLLAELSEMLDVYGPLLFTSLEKLLLAALHVLLNIFVTVPSASDPQPAAERGGTAAPAGGGARAAAAGRGQGKIT